MARAKETESDETATETEDDGDDGLAQKIRATVSDVLGDLLSSGKAEVVDKAEKKVEATEDKPLSYREEESQARRLVGSAVLELLNKEKAQGEKHEERSEKAPAEQAPGAPKTKKLTKFFWGEG